MKKHKSLKIEDVGHRDPKYYKKIWLTLEDGGGDTWLYAVSTGMVYIFIKVDDMVACCGRDATEHFRATVGVVDLLAMTPEMADNARRASGYGEDMDLLRSKRDRIIMAQLLLDHGSYAPLWNDSAGTIKNDDDYYSLPGEESFHFRKLRAAARHFAEEELFDEERRDKLLDTKIVNGLGQTAREYAGGTGSLWDSLRCIQALGDKATPQQQRLMLKMYQNAETTLGAGPVPEDIKNASAG